MKKWFICLILIAVMTAFVLPGAVYADGEVTLHVDSAKGDDSNSRSEGAIYKTIDGALYKAQNGDTIMLDSDVTENITISKEISLDLNGHILQGTGSGSAVKINGKMILNDSNPDAAHSDALPKGGLITGGKAVEYGGGVYMYERAEFIMNGGCIYGNNAQYAGGVFVYGIFTMNGGSIRGNYVTEYGHGVEIYKDCTFIMNGGEICDNGIVETSEAGETYTGSGGGVYNNGGTFTMNGGVITQNKANYGGGTCNNGGTFTMNGGVITQNKAKNGGGVCINKGTVEMVEGLIQYNNAQFGCGVFAYSNAVFEMTGGTIDGNGYLSEEDNSEPNGYGGGLYNNGGEMTLKGGKVSGNQAKSGGGFYNYSGTLTLDGCELIGNSSSIEGSGGAGYINNGKVVLTEGEIYENIGNKGAGLYINNGEAVINGAEIMHNSASYGGGLYINGGTAEITAGEISENTAQNGGGVYINANGSLMLRGGAIKQNRSDCGHGVMMVGSGVFRMTGGEIIDNTESISEDTNWGGGIWCLGGSFTMEGGKICGNKDSSLFGAGGIAAAQNASVKITDGIISYNSGINGGGIHMIGGTLEIIGGTITGNTTEGNGGGVYFEDDTNSSSTCTVTLGGNADISGNVSDGSVTKNDDGSYTLSGGTTSNLYLPKGKKVELATGEDAPGQGMNIGVTSQTAPSDGNPVQITGDDSDATGTSEGFVSDNGVYYIGLNTETKKLYLSIRPTVSVAKAKKGDPAVEAENPVYGTPENERELFEVTKKNFIGTPDLQVEWKHTDENSKVTWNTEATASGLVLTPEGKITISETGKVPAGEYVFRITNGLPETIEDPESSEDPKAQIPNPDFVTSTEVTLTVDKRKITVSGIKATDRIYVKNDTQVGLDFSGAVLEGKIAEDDLKITATGQMADDKAGKDKKVTICNLALSGESEPNYELAASGNQNGTTVTISKIDSAVTSVPEGKTGLAFTSVAQDLVTAGTAQNGTMQYALGDNNKTAPAEGWSDAIPVGTNAKSYYVWYKSAGNENYNDTEPVCVQADIAKKDITNGQFGEFKFNLTYNGQEQQPAAEVKLDGIVVTGSWSRVKDCSDKTTFTADGNFTGTIENVETKMAKSTPEVPSGLEGVAPSKYINSDGKISGTTTEMEYSTSAEFATGTVYSCGSGETSPLPAGTYYVRKKATDNTNAGNSVGIIIPAGPKDKFETVTVTSYSGEYDGGSHGITLNGSDDELSGAGIVYGLTDNNYDSDNNILFSEVTNGAKTVYVKISRYGYEDFEGSGTVTITPRNITDASGLTVTEFNTLTYSGSAQTPEAEVKIGGLSVSGGWSSVTNVSDSTTFTATGNFTGTVTKDKTGMLKATPSAPTGLSPEKPSHYGLSDGKIKGTSSEMEYSTDESFSSAEDCLDGETVGLSAGTYYVRKKGTSNLNPGEAAEVTIPEGDKSEFKITVNGYSGEYDGKNHGLTLVFDPETDSTGATVSYGTVGGTYDKAELTYKDFTDGPKQIFVKVTKDGYNNFTGSGTVNISKKDITDAVVGAFAELTYNGTAQTPSATVTIDGLTVPGTWTPVTTVGEKTSFTITDTVNFTGSVTSRDPGMKKSTPAAPDGLTSQKASGFGKNDGKILGTTEEMEYCNSTDTATWIQCTGTEISGLATGTYYVRYIATSNTEAGSYKSVTVDDGAKENFNITINSYDEEYDGQLHGIELTGVPDGATVKYSIDKENYGTENILYKEFTFEPKNVYVWVTKEGYNDFKGEGTVNIRKKNITDAEIGQFDSMTYDGTAQTPKASVTIDGLNIPGSWSAVTNVGQETTFTILDTKNFTGLIPSQNPGMTKATPAVPAALVGVRPTGYGRSDGKITGTTTTMEYSTDSSFKSSTLCTGTEITGLPKGTYYVRIAGTDNTNPGVYKQITLEEGDNYDFDITVTGYDGAYDGKEHGLKLTGVPAGAAVKFGTVAGTYDKDSIIFKDVTDGEQTVCVEVTMEGYNTYHNDNATVNIRPKDITGADVGEFAPLIYSGNPQSPKASVMIAGLSVTGTWSPVTNVSDTTTFTASGNFKGSIPNQKTGMLKLTPDAPSGLDGVKPSGYGKKDGKITGTTSDMEYSITPDFSIAYDCDGPETAGLAAGTYYVRMKATKNTNPGSYRSVVLSEGDKGKMNIVITNYSAPYDGRAHGIILSGVPEGATVKYGTVDGVYDKDIITYKDFTNGEKHVYVSVVKEGYHDFNGGGTVNITRRDITNAVVGEFNTMTYTGKAQTPVAGVSIDGLSVSGTWSNVTNVDDLTAFVADGNYIGTIAYRSTGMKKSTPAAPSGLKSVKPTGYGLNDGKITGTTAAMEYSTSPDFTDARDCGENVTKGLPIGTYYVRVKETGNTNAGPYASVIISDGDRQNFSITVTGYTGVYDGNAHGVSVSGVPAGAVVEYSKPSGDYGKEEIYYTDATDGGRTVFVRVSKDGYNDYYGSGVVNISKRNLVGVGLGSFEEMTYTGSPQTPNAIVVVDGIKVTGTWSEVTNVNDRTTFTANGNFEGVIKNQATGMMKSTPKAPKGLKGIETSDSGKNDGKITGTTADMEYSTDRNFTEPVDCTKTKTSGLAAGTYYVRLKETENTNTGEYTKVIIDEGDSEIAEAVPVESYDVRVIGDDTVFINATVNENTVEFDTISQNALETVFEEDSDGKQEKTLILDLSDFGSEINEVILTKETLDNLTRKISDSLATVEYLEIQFPDITLILDSKIIEAVNEQAAGTKISLTAKHKDISGFTPEQQKTLKKMNVISSFDIKISSDDTVIDDFKGGYVEMAIKLDSESEKDADHYFVYCLKADGSKQLYTNGYSDGEISFVTGTLPDFVIVYNEKKKNDAMDPLTDATPEEIAKAYAKLPYLRMSKIVGLGNQFNLTLTNVADDANITYISSDDSIATVENNGVITAVGVGKCTITGIIKQNGVAYRFAMVVYVKKTNKGNRQIKSSECLTPDALTPLLNVYKVVIAGKPFKLAIKKLPKNASVTYRSEDESIATISEDGVIIGLKKGFTGINVYVELNGMTYRYRLYVRVSTKKK